MSAHLGLDENNGQLRVDAGRQQQTGHLPGLGFQDAGLLRHGDSMQVDDTKYTVKLGLHGHPLVHRPQIVANMKIAGRLNTREDSFLHRSPS